MIKEKDFIEIDFTGKLKDEDLVFDTTKEDVAKENGFYQPQQKYGAKVICVGQGQVLKGLDKDLMDKVPGKEYTVEIAPEDGFGKKSAKMVQLVPTSKFKKENINPVPGLQVDIDNHIGIIKTVTGGRCMVDFNHPLSSKELVYDYKINKLITNTQEKADAYIKVALGLPAEVEYKEGTLTVKLPFPLGDEVTKKVDEKLMDVISEIKKVDWKTEEPKAASKAEGKEKPAADAKKE